MISLSKNWRDLSSYQTGKVPLLQAFGFKSSTITMPSLSPALAQTAAAQSQAPVAPSQQSQAGGLGKTEAANKALAQQMTAQYGWNTPDQWNALNNIVMAESGWNNQAQNAQSGAYGIPQALPYNKMPKVAWPPADGGSANANAQIAWMLQYIKGTYGNPVNAWAFHQANGFY